MGLSRPMLDRAAERVGAATAGRVVTVQGDVREINVPAGTFDVILAAAVLHHLRSDAEWEAVFGSFFRWPRPGGAVWVFDLVESTVPRRAGPDLVTARQLKCPTTLARVLAAVVRSWGGPEVLSDPGGVPVLSGGLALCHAGGVLVEPACCGDLGNLADWKAAAAYRGPDWAMVWVGHPWVSARFRDGRVAVSGPHESHSPAPRWAVRPEDLGRAVAAAEAELEGFARDLRLVLGDMRVADAGPVSRTLAGLG